MKRNSGVYIRNYIVFIFLLLSVVVLSYLLLSSNREFEKHSNIILERLRNELKLKRVESFDECFNATRSQETQWETWLMQPAKCKKDVDVVILIKSSIDRNANRRIIRKTWAREAKIMLGTLKISVRPIFVIGVPRNYEKLKINPYLQAETDKYGDILQINAVDGYILHTLLRKVFNGFHFIQLFCSSASMIVLSDDDAIIVPWLFFGNLVPTTEIIRHPTINYVGGVPFLMSLVPRTFEFGSRAEIPFETYPCQSMPIYMQGFAMVFSMGAFNRLIEEMHNYYSTAFSDDVYLSWLARRLKIDFDQYPSDIFEGSCLVENSEQAPTTQYEKHVSNNRIESVAIVHQCETPELLNDLWGKLCESFIANDTLIMKLQAFYCDSWLRNALGNESSFHI